MKSKLHHPLSPALAFGLLALLILFPWVAGAFDLDFYVSLVSRLLIFALAATSLNLILGFGGMVSLGHAAFFGAGAYTIGILMQHDIVSGWISWPAAVAVGALLALVIGSISLRTRGVYFIMITLAFAQMIYYVFISLRNYGGDDGMPLFQRSNLGFDISTDTSFYYVVLVLCALSFLLVQRLVNSRFGRTVQAIRENEIRMEAIGYPVFRYKLVCFVIGGALGALAGALLANQNMMVSPNMVHWTQSGALMMMVILGGVGYLWGGVIGAVVFLMLEEVLAGYTIHWQLALGLILLTVVLVLPNGIASLLARLRRPA
jgi:branched-chain amino acid transport system permease protein